MYGTITAPGGDIFIDADKGNGAGGSIIRFAVDDNEAMRIDSSGNIGIGQSSPAQLLHLTSTGSNAFVQFSDSGSGGSAAQVRIGSNGNDLVILNNTSSNAATERMRTKSTGEVKITQDSTSNALFLHNTGTSAGRRISVIKGGTTNTSDTTTKLISFERNDGTEIGKIRRGGFSSVAYDTSSDYRIKSNVVSLTGAIDRVKEFNPVRFNWLEDTSDTPIVVDGFLAHEAQTVVPEAVSGYKNEVDEEGNPVLQGIDQSKLVPLLTAALQEAIAKIETLEQRLSDAGIA